MAQRLCICVSAAKKAGRTEISEFYLLRAEFIRLVYEIYLKRLACVIVEAGKSEILRAVQRAGHFRAGADTGSPEAKFFLLQVNVSFAFKDFPRMG